VIVLMVLVINTLNSIGTDGSFGNEDTEHSLLSTMSKAVTPLLAPMGIHQDNWPATVGVFTGILAKETVVGTLDALYTHLASDEAGVVESDRPFDFWQSIGDATATVPENLLGIKDLLTDPLAMDVGDISSAEAAAQAQAVNIDVFGAMAARFDGQAGAFAYLLFILLYSPCVATIGAIRREAGPRWATFVVAWSTGIAFISASLFYQMATYADHPQSALVWIISLIALLVAIIGGLRYWSLRSQQLISEVGA
ncbi:MAG: ferrous iron transporter B, partial [Candidatus Thiodiazotropha sp. (ex Lucinoma annulata)]|nr:ferrous iron transporter B [Candidatus Thiodiazotropha sp. (ex Lucinoma annulata)]